MSENGEERTSSMLGMLVVTHGALARELVASARTIVTGEVALEALSIDWNDDVEQAAARVREAIDRVDQGRGVLLLTDMFGGTPTNLALAMLEPGRVEIVTGANLPMVIKFLNLRKTVDLAEAATRVARQGRESVQVASKFLEGKTAQDEGEEA
jgi:PTS system mannose-specific IIA component